MSKAHVQHQCTGSSSYGQLVCKRAICPALRLRRLSHNQRGQSVQQAKQAERAFVVAQFVAALAGKLCSAPAKRGV